MFLLLARVLLTLGLVAVAALAHAQYTQLSTNPASLIFGVFKAEAEIPLNNNFAIEPEAAVLVKGQRFWTPDYDSEGYRLGLVGKKYFDASKPHEGFYGFVYARNSKFTFTDYVEEGGRRDQRDFERARSTIGFGVGHAAVGKDGFYYGFSLGIGRHFVDDKKYTTPALGPGGEIFDTDDAEFLALPIDVYGRVSMGLRLYNDAGRAEKDAYEKRLEAEEAEMRDRVQQNMSELELRREELRRQRLGQ